MQLAPSRVADILIAWLERFELNELKNEKATALVDDVLLEISQRAEQARRRAEWDAALRHSQLALDRAREQSKKIKKTDAAAKKMATYSEAVVRFYAGALGLALNDTDAALNHFRSSAKKFGNLERHRARSIACAAIGIAQAGRRKWAAALEAYQQSLALIDQIDPQDSSLKELRRQIVQTVPMILDCYEQEASPDNT